MRTVDSLTRLPQRLEYPLMAIGVFDGLHLGHQYILRQLVRRTKAKKGTSLLLTFSPHPQKIISPADAPPLLQTDQQKEDILGELGVDVMVRLPFTRRVSLYSPADFAREVLCNHGIREIHVGQNFRFGHRRGGDLEILKSLGKEFSFQVHETAPLRFRGQRVSSTYVRRILGEGRIALARRLLLRPYQIRGVVVRDSGKGVELGFPTANLDPENELIPANGVYATRARLSGSTVIGVTNIGHRPTLHPEYGGRPVVETHLLDFDRNIYGNPMGLDLFCRLRAERKFAGLADLVQQIEKDVEKTRQYFARVGLKEEP